MSFTLFYAPRALEDLEKIPKTAGERILRALENLAEKDDPERSVKRLQNSPLSSLRVGDYRVILDIKREKIIIFVLRAGLRKMVYHDL